MNKKYLSVILFSALMLGTTGTFTSCKDYDDDIKNLQEQIDKKASLEELQKQMDAMQADVDAAKAAAEEAKNKAQEALDKANAAGGGDVTSEELQALKDDLQAQIDKLASLEDVQAEIDALKKELANTYATQEALDALKTKVDTLSDKVASIVGNLLNSLVYQPSLYINGVEATEYPWMQYLPKTKSTTDVVKFQDDEDTWCTVTTKPEEWNYENQKENKEFDPVIFVDYHVNPSKAKLAKENLKFISGDAEVVNTRASIAAPQIATDKDIKLENGMVSVPMVAVGSKICDNGLDYEKPATKADVQSKASIFALQANVQTEEGEDRVVTSDYAALCPSIITPQAIAYSVPTYNGFDIIAQDCENTQNNDELWGSVEKAIKGEPTLRVAYNSEIDLSEVLAIHYNQAAVTSSAGTHKVWKWGEEAQYGLKYDFALIQYTAGDNKTSDSKYVDQTLIEKGIVAPRMVEANGETSTSTGISSVGRHPLVRVRVLDKDGEVVLHAYIKVEIVQTIENIITDVFDKGDQKFGCKGSTPELTWAEVSNLLLEKVEYSKEEFLALYRVDREDPKNEESALYQFELKDNKFVKATDIYGIVTEKLEEQGTTNPVLSWALSMKDQQRIYDLNGHTKTIYVRYVKKTENPNETTQIAPVYLPIKVTVVKPQGTVVKKIAEYWYNDSKNTRLNVQYPKDGENTEDFTVDLDQVWEGNKPTFGVEGFDSYKAADLANRAGTNGGYKYYFTAANNGVKVTDQFGNEYELFAATGTTAIKGVAGATDAVDAKTYDVTTENVLKRALLANSGEYNNDALYAKVIKTVEGETFKANDIVMIAKITNDPVATDGNGKCTIKYLNETTDGKDNVIAKRILNAYKDELAAQIGICAYSNPCGIALSLNGATYPANLLRPITITDNSKGEFLDAQANGSTINIAEVFNFVDWRNVSFYNGDKDYKNVWLYAFYGLNKIEVKTALITTNLNGNDINTKLLSEVTKKIIITQEPNNTAKVIDLKEFNAAKFGTEATWNAIVDAFGKIKYVNNGNNVETFKVRIPVDFTYTWGTIRAYVECTVNSTMGQN